MCVYSVVSDYYRDRIWPNPKDQEISWDEYQKYLEVIDAAKKVDELHHQPDCVKPEVAEWERDVEEQARKWREKNM